MNRRTRKGRFKPLNPQKYKGDPTNIIYRSWWERNVMSYLDRNESVLEWSSEEIIIPYVSPWDGRVHRYFPDFYARLRTKDGNTKEYILEVKPARETQRPEKPARVTKRFLQEVATWGVNEAKWTSARKYCAERNMAFEIITENDMDIKWPAQRKRKPRKKSPSSTK